MIKEQARRITKEAKYLTYPITEIVVKLSSLADEHGLEKEMDYALDEVREAQNKLESAFFRCEDVFYELEMKENEYDEGWINFNNSQSIIRCNSWLAYLFFIGEGYDWVWRTWNVPTRDRKE